MSLRWPIRSAVMLCITWPLWALDCIYELLFPIRALLHLFVGGVSIWFCCCHGQRCCHRIVMFFFDYFAFIFPFEFKIIKMERSIFERQRWKEWNYFRCVYTLQTWNAPSPGPHSRLLFWNKIITIWNNINWSRDSRIVLNKLHTYIYGIVMIISFGLFSMSLSFIHFASKWRCVI